LARISLASLMTGGLAVLAPMAHVLELPDKLSLEATLWLAVQQNFYRGRGPFVGAPVELALLRARAKSSPSSSSATTPVVR